LLGHRTIGDLDGTLADHHLVRDLTAAFLAAVGTPRAAADPPGAQALGQVGAQRASGLDVQRLVDRVVVHPHLRVVGKVAGQPRRDLLRGVPPAQILFHPPAAAGS
jgi:hypothetical protein